MYVSETPLSTEIPDAAMNIPNYTLFRRDRGWADLDERKKGVYIILKTVFIRSSSGSQSYIISKE